MSTSPSSSSSVHPSVPNDDYISITNEYALWLLNGGQPLLCDYGTIKDDPFHKDNPIRTCTNTDMINKYCNTHTCAASDPNQPGSRCRFPIIPGGLPWCVGHAATKPRHQERGCGEYTIEKDGHMICPRCQYSP
jgi:hypothetical protein